LRIQSSPIDAELLIGEEKKFDLTADGIYDISITLNSIASLKANVTAKLISEEVETEKKQRKRKLKKARKKQQQKKRKKIRNQQELQGLQ